MYTLKRFRVILVGAALLLVTLSSVVGAKEKVILDTDMVVS